MNASYRTGTYAVSYTFTDFCNNCVRHILDSLSSVSAISRLAGEGEGGRGKGEGAKGKGQGAKGKGQRVKGKGQRAKGINPAFPLDLYPFPYPEGFALCPLTQ
jgi:hypothetical protein